MIKQKDMNFEKAKEIVEFRKTHSDKDTILKFGINKRYLSFIKWISGEKFHTYRSPLFQKLDLIVEQLNSGVSFVEVSKQEGISKQRLSKVLKVAGYTKKYYLEKVV